MNCQNSRTLVQLPCSADYEVIGVASNLMWIVLNLSSPAYVFVLKLNQSSMKNPFKNFYYLVMAVK